MQDNTRAVKVSNTTFIKGDIQPNSTDGISELLHKLREIKAFQHELVVVSKDCNYELVKKFVDEGAYDALQVKPNILRQY